LRKADPEIICIRKIIKDKKENKKAINASKIYSPSGKFAERAKKTRNVWQSLANSPLSAAVSPPSK